MTILLHLCPRCKEYTLKATCPRCGSKATPDAPPKYSPEDNYGEYRRKLKRLVASEKHAGTDGSGKAPDASPPPRDA